MIGIGLERNSGSILGLAQRKLPLYSQNLESLKCFNQTGSENMGSPQSFKHRPLMLFATDHEYLKNDFISFSNWLFFLTIAHLLLIMFKSQVQYNLNCSNNLGDIQFVWIFEGWEKIKV